MKKDVPSLPGRNIVLFLQKAARTIKGIPLPFDVKVLLFFVIEVVIAIRIRGVSETWRKKYESIRRLKKGKVKGTAIVTDGETPSGKKLVDELVCLGYTVIFGGSENKTIDQNRVSIKYNPDHIESVEAFAKRIVEKNKTADLLILNYNKYEREVERYRGIDKQEKKILPSKRKEGFITKNGPYRQVDRILLEKNKNVRRNYLSGFILIKNISPLMRNTNGKVIILSSGCFGLTPGTYKSPLIPSAFYNYCYSKLCLVLLALGAKTLFTYLDVRVLYPGLHRSQKSEKGLINRLMGYVSIKDEDFVASVVSCALATNTNKSVVKFYSFVFEDTFDTSIVNYDRANDLWEQAEVVT